MEAPKKIYLQEPTKVRIEKKYDNDVEYIRTDAFINKACDWLRQELVNFEDYSGMGEEFIEDFTKYMNN